MDKPRSLLTPAPACEPAIGHRPHSPGLPSRSPRRTPHDGRSGAAPRAAPRDAPPSGRGRDDAARSGRGRDDAPQSDENQRSARQFAERALRLTLEVLDHRRAPAQLRSMADPAVVDVIRVLAGATPPGRDGARLHRLHLRLADPHTVEVFGTYLRGPRVLALAAQLTLRPTGWRVSALHIG